MKTDFICIGQAVIDCITRGQENDPYKENVFRAERISLHTGGDAVNESYRLSGMGYQVKLVCGLGNDLAGSILLSEAKKRGIDVSCVTMTDRLVTPVANLMVRKDGTRYSINSSATRLEGYIPEEESVKGAKIVSFASLFRAPLDDPEVIKRLIVSAYEDGAVISCDTKLPTFRHVPLEELKDVLPLIHYIFPNEKEAAFYTGEKEYPAMAEKLHAFGIPNVIIKTGSEGCFASLEEGRYSLPAPDVPVVDTTGAGDSFVAGFLSGVLAGRSRKECLEAALRTAGECVQHMGAI